MRGWAAALLALFALALGATAAAAQTEPASEGVLEGGVVYRDVVWARPDGMELLARIFEPADRVATPLPTIVDVHGGVWNAGDRTLEENIVAGLARAGLLVVAIDFRHAPAYQHPVASRDATAAVRWVRLNAVALGADPARVGVMGGSSGGHLALLAGLRPNAPEHHGTPIVGPDGDASPHDDIDASVAFIAALWPVSDPQARYRYAQRSGAERLAAFTEAYFPDEEAMLDASAPRIVTSGAPGDLPPLLVVQSGMDTNIPQEMTFDLLEAYQSRDGKVDYAFFPKTAHMFGLGPSTDTDDLIALIADFARRRTRDPAS
jgi:acetyl esterase/lipase